MAVNLFPTQFRALNLSERVSDALAVAGVELRTLTNLRDLGAGIAFDDFGTGFASLSSLQRYPLTKLKIDRGFVRDIDRHLSDAAITKALIAMSADLGLATVAEGIETEQQEAILLSMGCPGGQGYRFGHPMSEMDVVRFLQGHRFARSV